MRILFIAGVTLSTVLGAAISPARRLAIGFAGVALIPVVGTPGTVAMTNGVAASCPAGDVASPIGPRLSAADSGRVYSFTLSPDQRELYFFKRVGEGEDYRIFRSVRRGEQWGDPERLLLGGEHSDLYPSLSPDGTRLVFSSYRPAPGDTSRTRNAHLWMARRSGDDWSPPEFVRASQLGYYHSGLSQDSDGTLHLRLTTPDWRAARDVQLRWMGIGYDTLLATSPSSAAVEYWRARRGDSVYVWGGKTGPGGLTLLQISRLLPSGGRSPGQYFLTRPLGDGWSEPVRAGGGLGAGAPNFAWFSADGCLVYYTRDYFVPMVVPLATVTLRA